MMQAIGMGMSNDDILGWNYEWYFPEYGTSIMNRMFDWVNYDDNCPHCKSKITKWQSKEVYRDRRVLQPWEVKSFYAVCDNCDKMVYASVEAEVDHVVKRCVVTLVDDPGKPTKESA